MGTPCPLTVPHLHRFSNKAEFSVVWEGDTMGQVQSIFSCASCSCGRANFENSEVADPPYGTVTATASSSPGRARSRPGSVGSADTTTSSISNTEASSHARASGRRSPSSTAGVEVIQIAKNTFSIDYLRTLAAWSEAGRSGSWHARMECAALVLCMRPGDVLIQRDDGKLEFLVKALWGGAGDYVVIPIPRPADKLGFWPPLSWDSHARTALGTAYPGWGATAADGSSVSRSGSSASSSVASTPNFGPPAEMLANDDKHASARPPLPPEQEWADYSMLDAALRESADGVAGEHITNIARKQIRARAYLVRSKHPRGLRDVSHVSVHLPALIDAHKAPT